MWENFQKHKEFAQLKNPDSGQGIEDDSSFNSIIRLGVYLASQPTDSRDTLCSTISWM
jgi:hypothetical protein